MSSDGEQDGRNACDNASCTLHDTPPAAEPMTREHVLRKGGANTGPKGRLTCRRRRPLNATQVCWPTTRRLSGIWSCCRRRRCGLHGRRSTSRDTKESRGRSTKTSYSRSLQAATLQEQEEMARREKVGEVVAVMGVFGCFFYFSPSHNLFHFFFLQGSDGEYDSLR
jgi:hypothetical protein